MGEQKFYTTKVVAKETVAHDVIELRVTKPVGFVFRPGQFVQWQVPTPEGVVTRSYSISSIPEAPYLEFCLKLVPEGKASKLAVGLERGDTIVIGEAKGVFVCEKGRRTQKVFIATGVGLAPIASMIEDILDKRATETVNLVFGVRYQEDIFWKNRLDNWKLQLSHFNYLLTVSRATDEWTGLRGHVTNHLESLINKETDYYICGNIEMVKDARKKLIEQGVNTKSIHFEIF